MTNCIIKVFLLILVLLSVTITAQDKTAKKDYSKLSLEELLEIEVTTAGKKSEKISDVPASVIVINRHEIEKYGYQSVEEILYNVSGLYLIDDYGWIGQKLFGVRGYMSTGVFDNMIVLINGVNQKSDGLLDSYPTERIEVPVESIERIEIIRGPMSVMYGSGAFFGAINIITNNITTNANTGKVTFSLGTNNTYKLYAGYKDKTDEFRYSIDSYIYSDNGIDQPFSKMMSDPSIVTRSYESGGWNLNSDNTKDRLKTRRQYFNVNGTFRNLTFDFGLIHSRKNIVETIPGVGDGSWVNYNNAHAAIFHNWKFSDKFSLTNKLSFFNDYHWVDNNFFFENSYTNNWSRANVYEVEIVANYKPTERLSLIGGFIVRSVFDFLIEADYVGLGFLPNLEVTYRDPISNHAAYVQGDFTPTEHLKFVAGIRIERLSPYKFDLNLNFPDETTIGTNQPPVVIHGEFKPQNDFEIIPRIGVIYSFNNNHLLKFLYGKAIKQPNATANLDVALNNSPQLKPAEISTLEINSFNKISPNFIVDISLFHNNLDNLISRQNILVEDASLIISTNAGKVSTTGVEAGIYFKPISELQFDLSMTYQSSKNERTGFEDYDLAYSPNLLAYCKIAYDFSNNITLAATARYVDEMLAGLRDDTFDVNNNPIIATEDPLQGRFGYPVPSYFCVDANVLIRNIFDEGISLNAKVINLFDEDIYFPTTASNMNFNKGTLGRERTFIIILGYEMNFE